MFCSVVLSKESPFKKKFNVGIRIYACLTTLMTGIQAKPSKEGGKF
jgi:hypothetical protein